MSEVNESNFQPSEKTESQSVGSKFIVDEYTGSYSNKLSLDSNILSELQKITGETQHPLFIREGNQRARITEIKEKPQPYRLTSVGSSDVLFINSAVIDDLVNELEEKLGDTEIHTREERHEYIFAKEFAKTVVSGIYEWTQKQLEDNLRRRKPGLVRGVKRRIELKKFWKRNSDSIVMLSQDNNK